MYESNKFFVNSNFKLFGTMPVNSFSIVAVRIMNPLISIPSESD